MEVNTRWKFLVGASILSGALLFKVGAPLVAVALGVALAALVTWYSQRRTSRPSR